MSVPQRARATTALTAVVLAALAVVAAACGIPTDRKARDIGGLDVAPNLQPAEAVAPEASTFRVYLTGSGRLAAVNRTNPATPEDAIKALLAGPTQAESTRGIGTSIPPGTELLAPPRRLDDGSLLIDVSRNFFTVDGEAQTQAIAQFVFTAMELDGVTGVLIAVNHERRAWNTSDGRRSDVALTKFDFAPLNPTQIPDIIPPAAPAPSTTVPPPPTAPPAVPPTTAPAPAPAPAPTAAPAAADSGS